MTTTSRNWKGPNRIAAWGLRSTSLTAGRQVHAITVLAILVVYLAWVPRIGAESTGCAKRVVTFKVTESDIAQIERGEAQGHQPWRNDPCMAAEAALLGVEPEINPRTAGPIPCKGRILSPTHEIFRFKLTQYHHIDQISLRRFHWRDPRTGKTWLTVWWATKAVISDCPKADRK